MMSVHSPPEWRQNRNARLLQPLSQSHSIAAPATAATCAKTARSETYLGIWLLGDVCWKSADATSQAGLEVD